LVLTLATVLLLFLLLENIDHGVEVFGLELDVGGPPADGDQQFC